MSYSPRGGLHGPQAGQSALIVIFVQSAGELLESVPVQAYVADISEARGTDVVKEELEGIAVGEVEQAGGVQEWSCFGMDLGADAQELGCLGVGGDGP